MKMSNNGPLFQLTAYGRSGDEHDCDFCREEHMGWINENQYLNYHWRKLLGVSSIVDSGYIWLERFHENTKKYNIDVQQKIRRLESDLQSFKEQKFLTHIMNFLNNKEDMMKDELRHQKFLLDKDKRLQITRDLFDYEAQKYLSYVKKVLEIRDAQKSVFWSKNPFSAKMPQELINHTKQYMDKFKTTHLTPPKLHPDLNIPPIDKIESNILRMLVRKDKKVFFPITGEMTH